MIITWIQLDVQQKYNDPKHTSKQVLDGTKQANTEHLE